MRRPLLILIAGLGLLTAQTKIVKSILVNETPGNTHKFKILADCKDGKMSLTIDKEGQRRVLEYDLAELKNTARLEAELEKLGLENFDLDILAECPQQIREGAWLGVQVQSLTGQLRKYFKLQEDGGVLISKVLANGPAAKTGLQAGDIILQVEDTRIRTAGELSRVIRGYDPGAKITIRYYRDGQEKETAAILEKHPSRDFGWIDKDELRRLVRPLELFHQRVKPDCDFRKLEFHRFPDRQVERELKDLRRELEQLKKELRGLKKR